MQVSLAVKTIDVLEDINEDATEYKTPSWPRIANYNVEISHRYVFHDLYNMGVDRSMLFYLKG